MNKIIFQIGLLAFFVSVVFFSIRGGDLLDVITRSFLVFVGAVIAAALILVGTAYVANASGSRNEQPDRSRTRMSDLSPSSRHAQPTASQEGSS